MKTEIPNDQHITYQLQFRKCGKASCSTCRNSQGHGPYWYAYWRVGSRLKSGYVGKVSPKPVPQDVPAPAPMPCNPETVANILVDSPAATPVLI